MQFEFDPGYIDRSNRPTLSQSFMDGRGDIVGGGRPTTSGEVPPFFSNLLPEGRLRTYLANRAGVRETREFELLELVGLDLSGAVDGTREGSDVGPRTDRRWPPVKDGPPPTNGFPSPAGRLCPGLLPTNPSVREP